MKLKTAPTVEECVRQAIGQLLEYYYLCGLEKFTITELVIVGYPPNKDSVQIMLQKLSKDRPYTFSYLSIPLQE